jgi:hypothetical protein
MPVKRRRSVLEEAAAAALVLVCALMIVGGIAVLWIAMHNRRQIRELEHRERLAMIERGLVPPPELDPEQFERKSGVARSAPTLAAARYRTMGVLMIGCGLALMMIISFAGDSPKVGIGIGGAFAVLGAAFVINSQMMSRDEPLTGRPAVPYEAAPRRQATDPKDERQPPDGLQEP